MTRTVNLSDYPPAGVVIALQYWHGDEAAAMRLARLMADVEPIRRQNVTLAFCRRQDCEPSDDLARTVEHVRPKFNTMVFRSPRPGVGHPAGPNALWSGTFATLAGKWAAGELQSHSAFFCEADGCPLRVDWLDLVLAEHEAAIRAGKRVTGAEMMDVHHVNGSLVAHLSLWHDRPSIQSTPANWAWDLFHAAVLTAEARPTTWIKNLYGAGRWSPESLGVLARSTAWLSSSKDDSALGWAEQTLVSR